MIDVPLTINFDKQAAAGQVQIEEVYNWLLTHPDSWSFAVAYIERDGVKTITEVSIVPIARADKGEDAV